MSEPQTEAERVTVECALDAAPEKVWGRAARRARSPTC